MSTNDDIILSSWPSVWFQISSYIRWICYERSFNEFYLSIRNQLKASVVGSVTTAVFIDFCLKTLNMFSQHIGKKQVNILIPQNKSRELICRSSLCVNYFLIYYLMMQHQPNVKRVNGAYEWAHRPHQKIYRIEGKSSDKCLCSQKDGWTALTYTFVRKKTHSLSYKYEILWR